MTDPAIPLPRRERQAWWNEGTAPNPAPPPVPPEGTRAAQWVIPGEAIRAPGRDGTVIVTGTITGTAGPRYARLRILGYAVLDHAGKVTAAGEWTCSAGTLVPVVPAESMSRRVAAQEALVAELAERLEDLATDATGHDGLTADDAREVAWQDLEEEQAALGRLTALSAQITKACAA